jgi:hypothetical protein
MTEFAAGPHQHASTVNAEGLTGASEKRDQ